MVKARDLILQRLACSEIPLALHQFQLGTVSQTSISARLRELRKDGLVESVPIPGRKFTAWRLKPAVLTLPLGAH